MVSKKSVAKLAFWLGALSLPGNIMMNSGALMATMIGVSALLMAPYLYLQINAGMTEASPDAETA